MTTQRARTAAVPIRRTPGQVVTQESSAKVALAVPGAHDIDAWACAGAGERHGRDVDDGRRHDERRQRRLGRHPAGDRAAHLPAVSGAAHSEEDAAEARRS